MTRWKAEQETGGSSLLASKAAADLGSEGAEGEGMSQ
jgi:hypothetical protein